MLRVVGLPSGLRRTSTVGAILRRSPRRILARRSGGDCRSAVPGICVLNAPAPTGTAIGLPLRTFQARCGSFQAALKVSASQHRCVLWEGVNGRESGDIRDDSPVHCRLRVAALPGMWRGDGYGGARGSARELSDLRSHRSSARSGVRGQGNPRSASCRGLQGDAKAVLTMGSVGFVG